MKTSAFVVRQFFMRNPAEERAQLHLVEEALAGCAGIVSFNGRGFDMPLINNRFVLASMPLPLAGAPHLDLLPPARRLWKARWGSCSLGNLERNVLGFQRTAEDVPGYLIPDIYRQYYPHRRRDRDVGARLLPQPGRYRLDAAARRADGAASSEPRERWQSTSRNCIRWRC